MDKGTGRGNEVVDDDDLYGDDDAGVEGEEESREDDDEVLTQALSLQKLGYAVHWLRPQTKIPVMSEWSKAPVMNGAALRKTYRHGYNVGFRPGRTSIVNGMEICVLDIDVRGGAAFVKAAVAAAEDLLGRKLRPSVRSGSRVGCHEYLGFPLGESPNVAARDLRHSKEWVLPHGSISLIKAKDAKRAWMVELLSNLKQVVVPPSVHPDTAQAYTWEAGPGKPLAVPAKLIEYLSQWGDPTDLLSEIPEAAALTAQMIPPILHRFAADVAHRVQVPIDFVAIPLIIGLGSTISFRCGVRPKRKDPWMEVPNLFGSVVASPGAKKTPAFKEALFAVGVLDREARERFAQEMAEWNLNDWARKEQDRIRPKGRDAKPLDDVSRRIAYEQQKEQPKPREQRVVTNDGTPEKLVDLLVDAERGLLVNLDELAFLLENFNRPGRESEQTFYLTAWNGTSSHSSDRIGRGSQHVARLCLSVFGGIQPDRLAPYLAEAAQYSNGFFERFQLSVYPHDLEQVLYIDDDPDADARSRILNIFRNLAAVDYRAVGAESSPMTDIPYLRFEAKSAQAEFAKWLMALEVRIANEPQNLMKQHLAKFRGLIPSLALIFELVEAASDRVYVRWIGSVNLQRAISFAGYLETHARKIYALARSPSERATQSLAQKIVKLQVTSPFKVRDIQMKKWGGLADAEQIRGACEELCSANWLREADAPQGKSGAGRPAKEEYEINPEVATKYATKSTKLPSLRRPRRRRKAG